MTEAKPKAIALADWADWFCRNVSDPSDFRWTHMADSAAELRRLQAERDTLLEVLKRLSFAALCRDTTMGDPCQLITVKAELQAANKQASDTISKVTGKNT